MLTKPIVEPTCLINATVAKMLATDADIKVIFDELEKACQGRLIFQSRLMIDYMTSLGGGQRDEDNGEKWYESFPQFATLSYRNLLSLVADWAIQGCQTVRQWEELESELVDVRLITPLNDHLLLDLFKPRDLTGLMRCSFVRVQTMRYEDLIAVINDRLESKQRKREEGNRQFHETLRYGGNEGTFSPNYRF